MGAIILPKGTRNKVEQYLINIIPNEDQTRFHKATLGEIRRVALAEKFANSSEKRYYRYNAKAAIRDWFQGLGMGVEYTYYDIAKRMRLWGYTVDENNEDDYYDKCDLYWDILAKVVFEGK